MTSLVVLKRVARWNGTRRYWRASWTELSPSIRALWILVVAMATLGTVLMGSQIGTSDQLTTVSVFSYAVAPIGAGMLLMWVAYRRRGPGVGAWILIGTGVVFWGIGELVWTYYAHVLGREVPYPGLADVMYVAAYPIIFVGVLLLPHVRPRKWERARLTLDALAGTIAVTAITWTFYLKKVVYLDPEAGFLENTVNLAYPMGDLILLIALIILTSRRSQLQFDGRLLVIGGGIILTAAADIWYLFQAEAEHRHHNDVRRRRKAAKLPHYSDLDSYDASFDNGVPKNRLSQLRELNWLDQGYNIMLMGPSGTGKTFLAGGLCAEAIDKGYKAYFRTMEELINMLKMKDMVRTATADYKRLSKADLIVIDDIMLFPVEKSLAVALFNFINQLYKNTCFIITTNKMAADWAKMLDDEVLATALLDRLLYRCEVINLSGKRDQAIFLGD